MDAIRCAHRPEVSACSSTSAHPDAERVLVIMGSGAETAHETVDVSRGSRREGRSAEGAPVSAICDHALS